MHGHSLHAWQLGEVHVDLKPFGGLQHKARPLHTHTQRDITSVLQWMENVNHILLSVLLAQLFQNNGYDFTAVTT